MSNAPRNIAAPHLKLPSGTNWNRHGMDAIKIAKVPDVVLLRRGISSKGTLHLTTHHMIFKDSTSGKEMWICYPIIGDVELRQFSQMLGHSTIRIRCRDFTYIAFNITSESVSVEVFDSIMKLTCVPSIEKLYAFIYKPGSQERQVNSWNIYNPVKEYERMGVDSKWRVTKLNKDYTFSPTYPAMLMVPESISDNVLNYALKFRSKGRLPALSYFHLFNKATITRCSQPMVGLKQNRSIQDEKLVKAIFATTQPGQVDSADPNSTPIVGASQNNLLVDARPTTNAMAQTALGAGTENMDYYREATKVYLGIENIHVMRDSLGKVIEALKNGDLSMMPPNQELLARSQWLKHLTIVLEGAVLIADHVHYQFSHVVIHCSDGWDRTSQLSSLAQLFLDPYYRTLEGFMVLIEKEWLSFGHRFAERSGFLSSEKHFVQTSEGNQAQQVFNSVSSKLVKQKHIKYTSPVFHQFLDCVYQILQQKPQIFEFNERFLRRLFYHTYSCQYGTFLYDNERERVENKIHLKTRSIWDYFLVRRKEFTNPDYQPAENASEIFIPDPKLVKWWPELYGRTNEEMNITRLQFNDSGSNTPSPYQRSGTASPGQNLKTVSNGSKKFDSRSPRSPLGPEANTALEIGPLALNEISTEEVIETGNNLVDNTSESQVDTEGDALAEIETQMGEDDGSTIANYENEAYDPLGIGGDGGLVTKRFDNMILEEGDGEGEEDKKDSRVFGRFTRMVEKNRAR